MLALGIETSCDDTSVAVLSGKEVLSNVKMEQGIHSEFGGVVPELASREHLRHILPLFYKALKISGIGEKDIELVSVTKGPGLIGSLLTGYVFAKTWAFCTEKPYVGVNHLEGHVYAGLLDCEELEFPFISLIISGGNTLLVLVKGHGEYELIGATRDDAAGEAIDKVGTLLGLKYPAGPEMEKLAEKGSSQYIKFPRPALPGFEFSYSGLKTAVLYALREMNAEEITEKKNDIAASFLEAMIESLMVKSLESLKAYKCRRLLLTGGVAANDILYKRFSLESGSKRFRVFRPKKEYCGDNAAMIAYLGQFVYKRNYASHSFSQKADPRLKFV
ncbi:tRNA (adenosine(37)-N6)-threonylcarbamoyltransferase complex transferase subunit TsaD [candidate division WOR-3 bacterium]|nr:tRNA (adenosine(37)-N6)-threonylcarbamoyltransferase complex transferase subunit TsaD [candidate division WOR-3 bacterium]